MLLFQSSETPNKTRVLDVPRLTIGRDEGCDIVVNDVSVSRQHAQCVRQTDEDYIQDLSSQNGTFVNEQLLMKPYALRTGDIIRIGNVRIQYVSLHQTQVTPQSESAFHELLSSSSHGVESFYMPGTHDSQNT
jgi:pSer/pThr/pTyr-binding forkhead associated (FHA) protein